MTEHIVQVPLIKVLYDIIIRYLLVFSFFPFDTICVEKEFFVTAIAALKGSSVCNYLF